VMAAGLLDGGAGSVLWRSWGWLVYGGKRWWKAEGFGQLRGKQKGVGGFRVQGMKEKNPKGEAAATRRRRQPQTTGGSDSTLSPLPFCIGSEE
jgi:hypothetical protein